MGWDGQEWHRLDVFHMTSNIYTECIYGVFEHTPTKYTYWYDQGMILMLRSTKEWANEEIFIVIII